MHIVPLQFTLREFNEHKTNTEAWFSEPFYTHPRGYRMGLYMEANGFAEYTHMYQFLFALCAETLTTPSNGHFKVLLQFTV